jgi:hypothetical protein
MAIIMNTMKYFMYARSYAGLITVEVAVISLLP